MLRSILKSVVIFAASSSLVYASPWLEASDPFLRSDLLLLSDAGMVNAPVNQYPLRWSGVDKPMLSGTSSSSVSLAQNHIHYVINNARLGRGNRAFKTFYASDEMPGQGFGQTVREEWGGYVSYEYLNSDYAYRLSSGYSKYNSDEEFRWNGSYMAFQSQDWLFSVGSLDRWWGQGWQHNLTIGSNAMSVPEMSLNYSNENKLFGNWNIEALVGLLEDSVADYHSALRFAAKPLSFWEFGVTIQAWSEDFSLSGDDKQSSFDTKISLPHFDKLYHSVYAEVASTDKTSEIGAWMIGWSGQVDISEHSVRIVVEKQQQTDEAQDAEWELNQYPHYSEGAYRNTYLQDSSISVAAYIQFSNDHKVSVIYQNTDMPSTINSSANNVSSGQVNYRLPALAGMLHIGVGYVDSDGEQEENIWTGYEFRF